VANNPINSTSEALKGFQIGGTLDAQTGATGSVYERAAYGNYVYGVWMAAAGFPQSVALSIADVVAFKNKLGNPNQYNGRQMATLFPFLPTANVANIAAGWNAQRHGTPCHK